MSNWNGSDRNKRLPPNWKLLRLSVLKRDDFTCQVFIPSKGKTCMNVATEVDHIVAGDNHHLDNLQAICSTCHRYKSAMEGVQARKKNRVKLNKKFLRTETHPSLM